MVPLPAPTDGGLGLGTVVTSAIFLLTILATVIYLLITKRDTAEGELAWRRFVRRAVLLEQMRYKA